MNIYFNKPWLKILIVLGALLIGGASLYYTHILVDKLARQEKKIVDLYAKSQEVLVNTEAGENLTFLFKEIVEANNTIPVILANSEGKPISHKNIDIPDEYTEEEKASFLRKKIKAMEEVYDPIKVNYGPDMNNYIYYQNSYLLRQLQYYPYIQLTVIAIFVVVSYLAFSYSRKAEQNKVWVGLAKETAHQLGTPISSLMAWHELLKSKATPDQQSVIPELEKDIKRLEKVTARFSSIGSKPHFTDEDIVELAENTVDYLKSRVSADVNFKVHASGERIIVPVCRPLMEWVAENLCKNAVDAMNGEGNVIISLHKDHKGRVLMDFQDTGKGISGLHIKQIFNPGFTTKERGWGLGLTLVKRIVEIYHKGKIFVKSSDPGKGTTFRLIFYPNRLR